jgi:hypothetical protein
MGQRNTAPSGAVAKKKAPAKTPGKIIAKADDRLPTDLTKAKAASLTKKIQTGVENVIDLLHEAYIGRVWIPLGHKDWDEYIEKEFGSAPLALPRTKRKATVQNLTDRGWSTRAQATALGVDQSTVARDQQAAATDANASVAPTPESRKDNVIDAEFSEIPEGQEVDGLPEPTDPEPGSERTVTGLDGKERTVSAKPQREQKRPDVIAEARKLATKFDNLLQAADDFYDEFPGAATNEEVRTILTQKVSYMLDFAKVRYLLPEPEPAV